MLIYKYNVIKRVGEDMEFLIINKNKLKVMMSAADMIEYGIDPKDAEYENPKTRQAFWRVLDAASSMCGFNVAGDKLLIQFYPSAEGSELFVTKLGRIGTNAERSILKSQNVTMLASKYTVYKFSDVLPMVDLVKKFNEDSVKAEADLYFCEDGNFYLTLEERSLCGGLGGLSVLGEFATEVPYALIPYIIEHSKKISNNGDAFSVMREL